MKRIIVGRSNDCDIVVTDETDNVSRHHLVISFNLLGKMKVSDTSSNGTFINGVRMLKGTSIPVTNADKIRMGRATMLDWDRVSDPYRPVRAAIISLFCLLVAAGIGFGVWKWYDAKQREKIEKQTLVIPANPDIKNDTWNKDSTEKVAPVEASIDVGGAKNSKAKSKSKKTVKSTRKKNTGNGVTNSKGNSSAKREAMQPTHRIHNNDIGSEKD